MIKINASDEILIRAISVRFSECFGAMSAARIFSGQPCAWWDVIENHSAQDIIKEAVARGINLSGITISIPQQSLTESFAYKMLYSISNEEEYLKFIEMEKNFASKIKSKCSNWELYYRDIRTVRMRLCEYRKTRQISKPFMEPKTKEA